MRVNYKHEFCFFSVRIKQIEIDIKVTKACAWGLYIFLVRRHCRKRPTIFFFFFLAFLLLFVVFSDEMGWCVTLLWGFSDCDPPCLSLKTHTLPPFQPQPPFFSWCSWAMRLRFTFVAIRLGSLIGNCLHLGCGVLHLCLAFSVIILHSLTTMGTSTEARENQKETKGEEILLTASLWVTLSQLNCLLWAAFCVIFQRKKGKKIWGKHARCFEGICFPSWNWMHFTHNGIKLTILARHQIRVHGCHSYFQGTMNVDVEWDRAGTVGTMHEGMKDWGITYNTNYNTQEDYMPSGLSQDTMERDFKAVLHFNLTFSGVSIHTPVGNICSNILLPLPFWNCGAKCYFTAVSYTFIASSVLCVNSQIAILINTSLYPADTCSLWALKS